MIKKYIRDGRAPIPRKESTSLVMSANRGKNTKPEIALRRHLLRVKLKNYKLNPKNIPGRPDIYFPKKKFAIFVHGCFWHRCPECKFPLPKSNRNFWSAKFRRNKARDRRKIEELKALRWMTLIVWEHEINKDINKTARRIKNIISKRHDVV